MTLGDQTAAFTKQQDRFKHLKANLNSDEKKRHPGVELSLEERVKQSRLRIWHNNLAIKAQLSSRHREVTAEIREFINNIGGHGDVTG